VLLLSLVGRLSQSNRHDFSTLWNSRFFNTKFGDAGSTDEFFPRRGALPPFSEKIHPLNQQADWIHRWMVWVYLVHIVQQKPGACLLEIVYSCFCVWMHVAV
jgi:hypothetical protein